MGFVTWELSIDVIWDQSLGSCALRSYEISHLGVVN